MCPKLKDKAGDVIYFGPTSLREREKFSCSIELFFTGAQKLVSFTHRRWHNERYYLTDLVPLISWDQHNNPTANDNRVTEEIYGRTVT